MERETEMVERVMSTGDVAKALNCSTEYVRVLERAGKLIASRMGKGRRVFDAVEVEQLAESRAKDRAARP
jgi:excisionase family DNA binding protein